MTFNLYLSFVINFGTLAYTHTHTHTHIYRTFYILFCKVHLKRFYQKKIFFLFSGNDGMRAFNCFHFHWLKLIKAYSGYDPFVNICNTSIIP